MEKSRARLLTPEETAEFLGVSPNTVRAWLRRGELKGVKLGGKVWRVRQEDIDDFIHVVEGEEE